MSKKSIIEQTTKFIIGLARLAGWALGGTILFVVMLLLGNLCVYTFSRVTEALFDMIKAIFGG